MSTGSPRSESASAAEDVAVALRVKVARIQEVTHRQDGVGVDQQAAEHRLFASRSWGRTRPDGTAGPSAAGPAIPAEACSLRGDDDPEVSVTSGWSSISTSWGPGT